MHLPYRLEEVNMRDLDAEASEYSPDGVTIIENELILNWYPPRIAARIKDQSSILELGIGHGITAPYFNKIASRHVVLDGSAVVIQQLRIANPGLTSEVIHTYFETFDTAERFDVIIMGFILEHVDDPRFILQRYKSLLNPGGVVYIAVPNAKSLNRRLGLELGLINDIYDLNQNDIALGHQRQYCLIKLKADVESCEYEVMHVEGIYLKPLPLKVLSTLDDPKANLDAMLRVGIDFPELCVAILMEVRTE